MIYLIAKFRFWKLFIKCFHITRCSTPVLKITQPGSGVASSDNWGGGGGGVGIRGVQIRSETDPNPIGFRNQNFHFGSD